MLQGKARAGILYTNTLEVDGSGSITVSLSVNGVTVTFFSGGIQLHTNLYNIISRSYYTGANITMLI